MAGSRARRQSGAASSTTERDAAGKGVEASKMGSLEQRVQRLEQLVHHMMTPTRCMEPLSKSDLAGDAFYIGDDDVRDAGVQTEAAAADLEHWYSNGDCNAAAHFVEMANEDVHNSVDREHVVLQDHHDSLDHESVLLQDSDTTLGHFETSFRASCAVDNACLEQVLPTVDEFGYSMLEQQEQQMTRQISSDSTTVDEHGVYYEDTMAAAAQFQVGDTVVTTVGDPQSLVPLGSIGIVEGYTDAGCVLVRFIGDDIGWAYGPESEEPVWCIPPHMIMNRSTVDACVRALGQHDSTHAEHNAAVEVPIQTQLRMTVVGMTGSNRRAATRWLTATCGQKATLETQIASLSDEQLGSFSDLLTSMRASRKKNGKR